jgi:hypothetical protein
MGVFVSLDLPILAEPPSQAPDGQAQTMQGTLFGSSSQLGLAGVGLVFVCLGWVLVLPTTSQSPGWDGVWLPGHLAMHQQSSIHHK